jgi:hypothetical protein
VLGLGLLAVGGGTPGEAVLLPSRGREKQRMVVPLDVDTMPQLDTRA